MKLGLYRHYKGANYQVYAVVKHSETEEELVLYKALYGDFGLWVRPLSMFNEMIDVQGVIQPRFAFVESIPETKKLF